MKIQIENRSRRQAGYSALFITLVLVGASVLVLGATMSRTTAGTRLNDRNCSFVMAGGAAEAAVEKVLARMMVDYAKSGDAQVAANLSLYKNSFLPTTNENPYWANFIWSDGQGTDNGIYVAQTSSATNGVLSSLTEQYAGLSGYCSTYRILANARLANSTYNYAFTNAVQQDVQLAQIPVFQFAIFYNSLLEFSDTATLTVNGRVHANSNIYVGAPQTLTFNAMVTSTGNITAPANAGYSTNQWSAPPVYNSTKIAGYSALTLPIGTSNTADNVRQIIGLPQSTDDSYMAPQRYYNKASMTIVLSNDNNMYLTFSSGWGDTSPQSYVTAINNVLEPKTNDLRYAGTNWNSKISLNNTNPSFFGLNYWLSTNAFYDFREKKTNFVTDLNVINMTTWVNSWLKQGTTPNQSPVYTKYPTGNPFNIIYFADMRTNGNYLFSLRLTNGLTLPSTGLTIATPNPLYIRGYYNAPNTNNAGSTNTIGCAPASVACDALTILSPAWVDDLHTSSTYKMPNAASGSKSDTVNTAIITGIVYSTGTASNNFSGGVQNLPRMLEDWSSSGGNSTLTLNTSIVCLYNSVYATNQFILPGNYYEPPTLRQFSFDQNFKTSSGMPPGTPNICRLVRQNWCNPPPGIVNSTNVSSWDFVAR